MLNSVIGDKITTPVLLLCLGMAAVLGILTAAFTLILTRSGFGAAHRRDKQLKISIPENFDYNGLFDDIFEKYTERCELKKVRTTNMVTLFELTFDVTLKDDGISKEFIDEIRSRNDNLSIVTDGCPDG